MFFIFIFTFFKKLLEPKERNNCVHTQNCFEEVRWATYSYLKLVPKPKKARKWKKGRAFFDTARMIFEQIFFFFFRQSSSSCCPCPTCPEDAESAPDRAGCTYELFTAHSSCTPPQPASNRPLECGLCKVCTACWVETCPQSKKKK